MIVVRLREKRQAYGVIMEELYRQLGISRQGMTKRIQNHFHEKQMVDQIGIQVRDYRQKKDRRAGSRSLYYNLDVKQNFNLGVTKFEHLMSAYNLTISPLKVHVITTQSSCQSWNYKNLISGIELNNINQVIAGDLTYVRLGPCLFYLFGLTDLYSARLVGLSVSERMRTEDAQDALRSWIKLRGEENLENCIHHTDGGGQYFSRDYLDKLSANHIQVSVAKSCKQNGYAEQRNGLIKYHLIPSKEIRNLSEFQVAILEIAYFYNHERKQEKLGWRTPVAFESYVENLSAQERPVMELHDFEQPDEVFRGIDRPKVDK